MLGSAAGARRERCGRSATMSGVAAMAGTTGPDRMLLIYQMAKVASVSWVALGRREPGGVEPLHVHYLAAGNLAFLRAQYEAAGPGQTILRRLLLRTMLRTGDRVRSLVDEGRAQRRPMLIATGMRDPLARAVSLLFFFADFAGHSRGGLSWRDGAGVDDVVRAFIEIWEQALGPEAPEDTFGRVLCFMIGAYTSWFDCELRTVFGIDLMRASFPPGPTSRVLSSGATQVLVYRVEDMVPNAPGHAILCDDAAMLGGMEVSGFPLHNATRFRNSRTLHRAFLSRLRMPPRLVDRVYDDRVVQYFYSPEEIARFRRRWVNGAEE
jgi:hypothetical protein